ncbi:hypothetical protein GGS26DRAFT_268536 [Hypomontagnella submonticulosa]|nr:hypothetical protein GGS26DRAFT_268536 [Hypomontagnella submonticulosa]
MASTSFRPLPPRQAELDNLRREVKDVVQYFSGKQRFEYVGVIGKTGTQGGAVVFNEFDRKGHFRRKIVAKCYWGDPDDPEKGPEAKEAWEYEGRVLEMLRGFPHIVNLLSQGRLRFMRTYGLLLEYSGYGTLESFLNRVIERDIQMPERVLWSMFYCLVQACITMKWPIHTTTGIPPENTPSTDIDHNDIHSGNVLLHGLDYSSSEHSHGPWLKLIDFGHATVRGEYKGPSSKSRSSNQSKGKGKMDVSPASTDSDPDYTNFNNDEMDIDELEPVSEDEEDEEEEEEEGEVVTTVIEEWTDEYSGGSYPSNNIYHCALLIIGFALKNPSLSGIPREVVVETPDGDELTIKTEAPEELEYAPYTSDLRDLLSRCTAEEQDDYPTLHEVYYECQRVVYSHDEGDYKDLPEGMHLRETDEYIEALLKSIVLDAEIKEDPPSGGRRTTAPAEMWEKGRRTKFPRIRRNARTSKSAGAPVI